MDYIERIGALGACGEAVKWLREANHPTPEAAWAACPRGDWMLWLAGRVAGPPGDPSRIPVVLAACDCAETVLHLVPQGEERPRVAIETTRAWARGEAAATEVQAAAAAATAAAAYVAGRAVTDAAIFAAKAAAYATAAVYDVNDDDDDDNTAAATAVFFAAYAAAFAGAIVSTAALGATLAQCADIVRRHYPAPPRWR